MISVEEELKELTIDKILFNLEEGILFKHKSKEYINYLERVLDNYNFKDDFSHLLYIYSIVPQSLCYTVINKKEKNEMLESLKRIREKIQILILQKPGNILKDNENFLLLKKLIDSTESLIIAQFYDLIDKYKGNTFELINYLLFELKEYNLVETIFNQYPYMVRLKNKDNVSLFEMVISNYLEEAKVYTENKELSNNYNLIYYDRVMELFLESDKLELSFKKRKDLLSHINYCRKNIKNDDYNNLTKRKLIYWFNHLEEKLEKDKHSITFEEMCYMYDIKDGFDEGILSEARRLNKEIVSSRYPNRTIINDEYIITIDGEDANELDDGVSVKKLDNGLYKLGIHIADPVGFLPNDSIILDGAYDRNTSIYMPQHTVFMFPEILSKDKMNLLENKQRLALSIYLYVNSEGKIEDYEFLETIISVNKNTTYNYINNILNIGNCRDKRLFKTSVLLNEVTEKLKNNFRIDDAYALVNRTESNPSNTNIITYTASTKIVETCMVMANYIVAYHMNKNNLPCINRIHKIDCDYLKKLSAIESNLHSSSDKEAENAIRYLKAIYPKAKYSVTTSGHYGLGLSYYSHVTSPLRRFSDVAMKKYVLEPFYFHEVSNKKAYETEEKLKEICRYMNERNIIVDTFMSELKKEKAKILTKG